MGKSSPKQRVVEYYMSISTGVCQGPVNSLHRIRANEKTMYVGDLTSEAETAYINEKELFGGVKKEGGVQGTLNWQKGTLTQFLPAAIATKLGLTPTTAPGYRGIATAHFSETPGVSSLSGFYWSANQPYLPNIDFEIACILQDWYPEKSSIYRGDLVIPEQKCSIVEMDQGYAGAGVNIGNPRVVNFLNPLRENDLIIVFSPAGRSMSKTVVASGMTFTEDTSINVFPSGPPFANWGHFYYGRVGPVPPTSMTISVTSSTYATAALYLVIRGAQASGVPFRISPASAYNNASAGSGVANAGQATPVTTRDLSVVLMAVDLNADGAVTQPGYDNGGYQVVGGIASAHSAGLWAKPVSNLDPIDPSPMSYTPVSKGWAANHMIVPPEGEGAIPLYDMNPAHIIYHCLTNSLWGMGAPTSVLDSAAFTAAADTLYAENFGLSVKWIQQTEIETFVQEILDHIEAALYVDPRTGLFVLKLIRDDYDPETLPILDESNSRVVSYSIRSPAEIINEINVTWTNPENEKEEVLTIQDLGGIVAAGGQIISDNRNYYGVRRKDLAWQLGQRDISAATAPLASFQIETDRRGWDYVPGQCIKVTSERHGVVEEIVRIIKVDYGTVGDSVITIDGTTDIFTFPQPNFEEPPDTIFVDPSGPPEDFVDPLFMTTNYFTAAAFVDPGALSGAGYPDAWVMILPDTENTDVLDYELIGSTVDAAGNPVEVNLGTRDIAVLGFLTEAFVQEAETTTLGFSSLSRGTPPQVGGLAVIGNYGDAEEDFEMVLISAFNGTSYTLQRGVLDTVPKAWPLGAEIRFFAEGMAVVDQTTLSAMDAATYKLKMRTSLGLFASPSTEVYTLNERPHLPYRPANVKTEGVAWATVNAEATNPFSVTWANRNRVTEDSQILSWDDADVTSEANQITRIRILRVSDRAVLATLNSTEGDTSMNITHASFAGENAGIVQVRAVRTDGGTEYESYTAYEQLVTISGGFGLNFGFNFGGAI